MRLAHDVQGELQQEVLEHVSVEGHRALAHFRKGHPLIPGMTLKVRRTLDWQEGFLMKAIMPASTAARCPINVPIWVDRG